MKLFLTSTSKGGFQKLDGSKNITFVKEPLLNLGDYYNLIFGRKEVFFCLLLSHYGRVE